GLGGYSYIVTQQIEQLQAPMAGVPVITLHQQRAILPATPADDDFAGVSGPMLLEIDASVYEHKAFIVRIETQSGVTHAIPVKT
ncbi:MAG: hypothetical protein ABR550_12875, partial [Wenzhouxiangellaceae bacterium]